MSAELRCSAKPCLPARQLYCTLGQTALHEEKTELRTSTQLRLHVKNHIWHLQNLQATMQKVHLVPLRALEKICGCMSHGLQRAAETKFFTT